MAAVKELQELQISPSLPSQPPQRLSFLDAMWLRSSHQAERIIFYDFPHPISHFVDNSLPVFIKSLSLTLHRFYLLAGSIRPSPDSDDQFEIVYEEGDSVTITIGEFTGQDFHNISGHHPRNFKNLHLLVPKPTKSSLGDQFPPLSIQITIFPNQGLCIGFALNHLACDGSGFMHFIHSWAAACRTTEPALDDIPPPFLDRSVIIDTHGICQKISKMVRQSEKVSKENLKQQDALPISDPNLVYATFTLGKDHIVRLKERVQAKGIEEGKPSFHISAFVVTCAYVWRCLLKAKGFNWDIKQYFMSPVDWRSRMRPSIPSNYFGNCLGACMAELKSGELVGNDGIEVAATEIGKSIDGLQGKDVGEVLATMIDRRREQGWSRLLTIAGSPKLRVYEIDFGWGRPVKTDITSIYGTGAISLAESREVQGGVEVGLILLEDEMTKFRTNFSNDLPDNVLKF